jgi:hypothetical protein
MRLKDGDLYVWPFRLALFLLFMSRAPGGAVTRVKMAAQSPYSSASLYLYAAFIFLLLSLYSSRGALVFLLLRAPSWVLLLPRTCDLNCSSSNLYIFILDTILNIQTKQERALSKSPWYFKVQPKHLRHD